MSIKTWIETAKEQPIEKRGIINNQMIWMQQEIDELRAAYEALQKELGYSKMAADAEARFADEYKYKFEALQKEKTKIEDELDEYKEHHEELTEHYKALQWLESEFRKENAAQAKRIAELESEAAKDHVTILRLKDALSAYGDPDIFADDED